MLLIIKQVMTDQSDHAAITNTRLTAKLPHHENFQEKTAEFGSKDFKEFLN